MLIDESPVQMRPILLANSYSGNRGCHIYLAATPMTSSADLAISRAKISFRVVRTSWLLSAEGSRSVHYASGFHPKSDHILVGTARTELAYA